MLAVIIICALAAIAAGFATKYYFHYKDDAALEINRTEIVVGSLLCAVLVIPLITWAGFSIVRGSTVSYNEYYSGLEKKAYEKVTICHRDGSCRHTYSCDPYNVVETYTVSVSNGNGGTRSEVRTRVVTKYHSCPYTDTEHSFYVTDTLGERYTFGDHWFPETPSKHRYRNKGFPSGIPKGKPAAWVAAKARIDSGNPGGTTKRAKYDNFIQASQDDIYAKASDAIADYKHDRVLPKVTTRIYDKYLADKVYLPTGAPAGTSRKDWQESLMRLNGKIGGEKHGDLHLVLVDSGRINDADRYSEALDAFWQSKSLGKNTLSKNGIVVVVGYGGGSVVWARGFTGMPVGNEGFEVAVREKLTNTAVTPGALVDAVGNLVFATGDDGYTRVEMTDYRYLFDSIQPSGWAKFWIAFFAFLLSLGVWAILAVVDLYIPIRNPFHRE